MQGPVARAATDTREHIILKWIAARTRFFLVLWAVISLSLPSQTAAEQLPSSILVLEQSDVRGPFYSEMFSALRSRVNALS